MRAQLAAVVAGFMLMACGGGGGSDDGDGALFVSVRFGDTKVQVFHDTQLQPELSGFEGRTARCELSSGSLPRGLSLNANCTVSGRPQQAGFFPIQFRITASGASGSVTGGMTIESVGPTVNWISRLSSNGPLPIGATINEAPIYGAWTPPAGVSLTWTYLLASGALPPGLELNETTGVVSGITTSTGTFSAVYSVTLSTVYGTHRLPDATYSTGVNTPVFVYSNTGNTLNSPSGFPRAYVSQPFEATPFPIPFGPGLSDFTLGAGQALPAGLTLDPARGRISGIAVGVTPGEYPVNPINATQTSVGGASAATTGQITIEVRYPFQITYPGAVGYVGLSLRMTPMITQLSPIMLVGRNFSFAPRIGECVLPPGTSFALDSGTVTGTPTVAGTFRCTVDLLMENNGIEWNDAAQFTIRVV